MIHHTEDHLLQMENEMLETLAITLRKFGVRESPKRVLDRIQQRGQLERARWHAEERAEAERQFRSEVLGFSPPPPPNLPHLCAAGCGCEVDGASTGCRPCLDAMLDEECDVCERTACECDQRAACA